MAQFCTIIASKINEVGNKQDIEFSKKYNFPQEKTGKLT